MAIGLDIGSGAVRAVQLTQARDRSLRLTRHGEVALPPGAVVDGDVVEPTAVVDALRELWDRAGLRRRTVALGLASQRITVRQLDLPELPDDELREAVRLQAQDQLPMAIDEALFDHVVVERLVVGDERRIVRLLLVAAERDMVERLLAAVSAAGLRPVRVDLDAFALVRSLASSLLLGGDVELIVDIGATVTKIVVHRGGDPLFVRMVRLGGAGATRQLQDALDLDWEGAEIAKLEASAALAGGAELDPDDERARVLATGAGRVVAEVRRSLDYFRTTHPDTAVQRALLSGGVSLTPALAEQLQEALELPVEHGGPLRMIEAPPRRGQQGDLLQEGPFLAVPIGLALGLLR